MTTLIQNTIAAWDTRASALTSWGAGLQSERGQVQRFLAVLEHLNLRRGDNVLDFGCGTGRLCEFLPERVQYVGFDWSPDLRKRAAEEHPRARIVDVLSDEMFDHIVAVGPFNLCDNWTKQQTWERLAELWGMHTRRSLVVSLYRGDDPVNVVYEPEELCVFARRMGCRRFRIDSTYLDNDLLLAMYR